MNRPDPLGSESADHRQRPELEGRPSPFNPRSLTRATAFLSVVAIVARGCETLLRLAQDDRLHDDEESP